LQECPVGRISYVEEIPYISVMVIGVDVSAAPKACR
jgi:hypothetical protein